MPGRSGWPVAAAGEAWVDEMSEASKGWTMDDELDKWMDGWMTVSP